MGPKRQSYSQTWGLGVKLKSIHIDYALTNIGESVGLLSNVFSLKFDITKRDNKERMMKNIFLTLLLLCPWILFGQSFTTDWIEYDKQYYKFTVYEDGIYRIKL